LLRVVVAIWGLAVGAIGVFIGYFTAVDWKTGESDWTLGAAMLILGGIAFAIYCLYGAFRPTRWSFLPPTILLGLSTVLSVLSVVAEFVRNLTS
jgi:hypothetical protein